MSRDRPTAQNAFGAILEALERNDAEGMNRAFADLWEGVTNGDIPTVKSLGLFEYPSEKRQLLRRQLIESPDFRFCIQTIPQNDYAHYEVVRMGEDGEILERYRLRP